MEVMELLDRLKESSHGKDPLPWSISGRIVYVVSHSYPYSSNGYAVRTHGIASALVKQGYSVVVINRPGRPWDLPGFSREVEETHKTIDRVRYVFFREPSSKHLAKEQYLEAATETIKEVIGVFKPTAVLAGSNWENALPAAVAARERRLPFYYEVRGFWELSREACKPEYAKTAAFREEVERDSFVAQQADKVFTLNEPMKGELIKRGVKSDYIDIVPNGVSELPVIKSADPALKAKLGIGAECSVVGYVGSFSPYEGLDTLIEACRDLVQKGKNVKLLLVGDDQPLIGSSTTSVANIKKDWLIQVGRVPHEQIADYYALIDVVVIPRKKLRVCELVPPMKVAEALAYGKRLVVSNVPPLVEYAKKYYGVMTFELDSAESLAQALNMALKMPAPKTGASVLMQENAGVMAKVLKESSIEALTSHNEAETLQLTEDSLTARSETERPSKILVAAILDEFTMEAFGHEVELELLTISPKDWRSSLAAKQPDFLFVESCWSGNGGVWERLVYGHSSASEDHMLELEKLVRYCKTHGVPTVFWSKEDPPHYEEFAQTAKLFDHVFTSDENMLPYYERDYGIRANVLPFFCQPVIHNPVSKVDRVERAAFAGTYYRNRPERCADFKTIIDSLQIVGVDLDIYDRCYHRNIEAFKFPEELKSHVKGYLDPQDMWKAYQGYKYTINLNSVKDSPTMFARRVYESLASATPVISNYSWGVDNMFGDCVVMSDDADILKEKIRTLEWNHVEYQKLRIKGMRRVLSNHQVANRIRTILDVIGQNHLISEAVRVIVVAEAKTVRERLRVITNFKRQKYSNKVLFFIGSEEPLPVGDYYAKFSSRHYYGMNYICDMVNAFSYARAPIVTKHSCFSDGIIINDGEEFTYHAEAKADRSLVKREVFESKAKEYHNTALAIDHFGLNLDSYKEGLDSKIEDELTQRRGFVCAWFFNKAESPAINLFKLIHALPYEFDLVHTLGDDTPYPSGIFRMKNTRIASFCARKDPHRDHFSETYEAFSSLCHKKFDYGNSIERYDFLLSRSMSVRSHEVALEIKKNDPSMPWIAIWGDPIHRNPYYRGKEQKYSKDARIEKEVLECADVIVVPNEYQKILTFSGKYKQYAYKAVVVEHAFLPHIYGYSTQKRDDSKLTLIHAGWLYKSKRNARQFLTIARRLIEKHPSYRNRLRFVQIGRVEDDLSEVLEDFSIEVELKGRMSYEDTLHEIERSDICVVLDAVFDEKNDGISFSPFLSGKLVDYMGARKPIFAVTMDRGPTADILTRANIPYTNGHDVDAAAELLKDFIDGSIKPKFSAFSEYSAEKAAHKMVNAIETAIENCRQLPYFSIIVSVYNAEEYLPACLDSILLQDFEFMEVIIVNDASEGECSSIVDAYSSKDSRIRYVEHHHNRGLFAARATGFGKAKGTYLLTVDADDMLVDGALRYLYDKLREYDSPDSVEFGARSFGHQANKYDDYIVKRTESVISNGLLDLFLGMNGIAGNIWNKAFRRDVLQSIDDIGEVQDHIIYREDILFNVFLLSRVAQILVIERPLYAVRRVPDSSVTTTSSADSFRKEINDTRKVFSIARTYYHKNGLLDEYRQNLARRYLMTIQLFVVKRLPMLADFETLRKIAFIVESILADTSSEFGVNDEQLQPAINKLRSELKEVIKSHNEGEDFV